MATEFTGVVIESESEPGHKKNPKLTRSFGVVSLQAFLRLLRSIQSRPSRVFRRAEPEADLYHRLIDELEDEEEEESPSRQWWARVLVVGEAVLLLGLVAALVATKTVDGMRIQRWPGSEGLRLWQWVVLVMVLFSGLPAVQFATFIVFTPIKWRWRIHRYVMYMVEGIKWYADVTLWLGLVLVAWYLWFRPSLRHVQGYVSVVAIHQITGLLIALVLGSFLWMLKNVLYIKLKADLFYDQLYDRIKNTVIDFHAIQIIYHEGFWKFLTSRKNMRKGTSDHTDKAKEREECRSISTDAYKEENNPRTKGINIWMDMYQMNKKTVPIWVIRRLAKAYLKQMNKVGLPRNRDATGDEHKLMSEAQQMLKGIIRQDGRSDILPKDLDKFGLEAKDFLFRLIETRNRKEQGKLQAAPMSPQPKIITRDQFLSWAVVAYKNCWGLERTLNSSEKVFTKLNRILSTFVAVVMLIVWLLLSKIVDSGQLALLFSPFLAATFIFGDTCKKMFEGLIFTFAMHPFDVGDRVVIDDVQMKVTQLNIMTSVFFEYETREEVVYPNSLLAGTKITNLDIAPDQADLLEFTIPSTTPLEDITDLELKIKKALDDDITYSPQTMVAKKEVLKGDIKMVVYFKYLVSYLAAETKAMHRSRILTKIMEFSREMENNVGKASSAIEVDRVDFILDAKVPIEHIFELKRTMFEGYESYKEHSKILMKSLDKDIEMAVYIRRQKSEGTEASEEELENLKRQIFSVIKRLEGRLKDHGGWSARRINEVWSLGRTSEKGAQDVTASMAS